MFALPRRSAPTLISKPYLAGLLAAATLLGLIFQAGAVGTQIQYLSGTDKDNTVSWNFQLTGTGRLKNVQTNIPVPSCWDTQGFGNYQYGAGSSSNTETGNYTYTFGVSNAWAGKQIFLVFEGAFTDTSVSINGHAVGANHQGGFYEFRFDVTTNVIVGANTNVLSVTVKKWSSSTNIMRAEMLGNDYWVFGGIYRPVYLEAMPTAHVDYVAANPLANGQITVNASLGGISNNSVVSGFVTDSNNVILGSAFSNSVTSGATNVTLAANLPTPNPWSSESPTLYTLTVQLSDTNGAIIHSVTNQIGFRTITFNNNVGFLINGAKVVLRGICHHEEWPTTGRTTSRAEADLDIGMIKDMNFNAVRLSHYPPNKVFLEECDRLGLYTLDEFASYQHGGDQNNTGPMDIPDGIRLIGEMIRRDVNHPCIIAWDNGNEGGWNPNLDGGNAGSTNYFAVNDIQNRHVVRPGLGGVFQNLLDQHYPTYSVYTNNLGAGLTAYACTEILHAIYDGGGGASLQEYWDAMRLAPNGTGMFVWSWDDEGLVRTDQGGIMDVSGQSAPDGIVGPFREKEASYYTYKSIYNPVQIGIPSLSTFNGTLAATNRFDFTDLSQCSFDWQLGWYPDASDPASFFTSNSLMGGLLVALDSGNFAGSSLAAGGGVGNAGPFALPAFPVNWLKYDALRLTATDPLGNNLYTWTFPLRGQAPIQSRILGPVSMSAPAIVPTVSASEIILNDGPRTFHFSKTSGLIDSLTVSNQAVSFTNGPSLVAGGPWVVNNFTNYSDGTNYIIQVNDITNAANGFQWILRPDGWLKLFYRYTLTGPQNLIGITFNYPSNKVTAMNWLGQGPYRVYKNRQAGQEIFAHTKSYNYGWTGQSTNYAATHGTPSASQWSYPEFEGFHGQIYWATLQTSEQPVTIITPTTNLFLCVLTPPNTDIGNDNPIYPPNSSISLLQGISAIGNKFQDPTLTGPAGQTNIATGLYTGEVDFFFGPPPAAGVDRDGNGLADLWELQYFNALGQNPFSTSDPDGQPLLVENAFNLSPLISNKNLGILPHFVPGAFSPAAVGFSIPFPEPNFFEYVPGISSNLINWFYQDLNPNYFLVDSVTNGVSETLKVEPNLTNWPGGTNQIFLDLRVSPKQ